LAVNVTTLGPADEQAYRQWMVKNGQTRAAGQAVDDQFNGLDYDYRGFYKENGPVDVAQGQHFSDKYKLPNHPTFSVESQYAVGEDAKKAGRWLGDNYVPPGFEVLEAPQEALDADQLEKQGFEVYSVDQKELPKLFGGQPLEQERPNAKGALERGKVGFQRSYYQMEGAADADDAVTFYEQAQRARRSKAYGRNAFGMKYSPEEMASIDRDIADNTAAYLSSVANAIKRQQQANALPMSKSREALAAVGAQGEGVLEQLGQLTEAVAQDPLGLLGDLTAENSLQMTELLISVAAARGAGAGRAGEIAVGFKSSQFQEFGAEYVQLRAQGVSHEEAWQKAGAKANIVGLFDAASFGVTGKAVDKMISTTFMQKVKAAAAGVAEDAIVGAGGEAWSQLVENGSAARVSLGDLFAEGFAELSGAPMQMAAQFPGRAAERGAGATTPPLTAGPEADMAGEQVFGEPEIRTEPEVGARAGEPTIVGAVDIETGQAQPLAPSDSSDALVQSTAAEGAQVSPPPETPSKAATADTPPTEGAVTTSQPEARVEAPRAGKESGSSPAPRKPLTDVQRADLESARTEIGWFEEGGKVIRDPDSDQVTGRTPWVGSELWKNRPSQGGRISDKDAHTALDKASRGEPLNAREQRWVDYVLAERQDERERYEREVPPEARLDASDFKEAILDPVADRELAELVQRAHAHADSDAVESALDAQDDDEAKRRLRALIARGQAGGSPQAQPATDEATAARSSQEEQAAVAPAARETDLFGADTERQAGLNRENARVARKLGEGRTSPPAEQAPRGDMFREAAEAAEAQAAAAQTDIETPPPPENSPQLLKDGWNAYFKDPTIERAPAHLSAADKKAWAGGFNLAKADERFVRPGTVDAAAHEAATSPRNDLPEPTPAQKEAGNYQKGHIRLNGLDISIENPRGSIRTGENRNGTKWSVAMPGHYGYIRGTKGKDKEHIDITVSAHAKDGDGTDVWVIDQRTPDGLQFDEHKVFMGYFDATEVSQAYRASFSEPFGAKMAKAAENHYSKFTLAEFKRWLAEGDHQKPAKDFRKWLNAQGKQPTLSSAPAKRDAGADNKIFTADAAAKARETLKKKLGHTFSGIDPEIVSAGITLAGFHIEAGARTFAAYSKAMIEDLGEVVRPYLRAWYEAVRHYPNFDNSGMDGEPPVAAASKQEAKPEATTLSAAEEAYARLEGSGFEDAEAFKQFREAVQPLKGDARKLAVSVIKPYADEGLNAAQITERLGEGSRATKDEAYTYGGGGFVVPRQMRADTGTIGVSRVNGQNVAFKFSIENLLKDLQPKTSLQPGPEPSKTSPQPGPARETTAATATPEPAATKPASKQEQALARFSQLLNEPHQMRDYRAAYAEVMGAKAEGAVTKAVDELVELAIVKKARELAGHGASPLATFDALVRLYERQPTLGVRTSTSVDQQAYSTPAPLAYLAANLARVDRTTTVSEPTAGNGMLLITADPKHAVVNELNPQRADALRSQGFTVTERDATNPLPAGPLVDAVLMNPPFGAVVQNGASKMFTAQWPDGKEWQGTNIDFAIAARQLGEMKSGGRAVLIVGGVNKQSKTRQLRSDAYNGQAKRKFYKGLYDNYNVTQHFTVDGDLYAKQGAAWPVDVIVIEGRGKSSRALPAVDVPEVYNSWAALRPLVKANEQRAADRLGPEERTAAPVPDQRRADTPAPAPAARPIDVPRAPEQPNPAARAPVAQPTGSRESVGGSDVRGRAPVGSSNSEVAVSGPAARAQQPDARPEAPGTGDLFGPEVREAGGAAERPASTERRPAEPAVAPPRLGERRSLALNDDGPQQPYEPASAVNAIGTLVPSNLRTALQDALANLQREVGPLDAYVAKELGYKPEELGNYFGAEQVDALAAAIYQFSRGSAAIIGDQTGIGKGRVVAGLIRWALRNAMTPIFVTEKPNLYADIYRDLTDIGQRDVRPFMTNAGEAVPLDEAGHVVLKTAGSKQHNQMLELMAGTEKLVSQFNMIFTTYNQMQTVKGQETGRMKFLRAIAPNAVVITDESHNAGGQSVGRGKDAESKGGRAGFVRSLLAVAKAAYHSSATYAKRPEVMDLYFRTDMAMAVEGDVEKLPAAIERGGVPLQQAVASMLTRAGQYMRRERSFAGVEYNTPPVEVDRAAAEAFSTVMMAIREFDTAKKAAIEVLREELKAEAAAIQRDDSVGETSITSTNFTSIMHNLVNQMLLALTVDTAASRAIDAIKAGEKPVLTVANTMGSFIQEYVDESGVNAGDPIGISFRDLLERYLERSRIVRIKDPEGVVTRHRLTDNELGEGGINAFRHARNAIDAAGSLNDVPVSPIDWLHNRLRQAGYNTSEITGRNQTIDYSTSPPTYRVRPAGELSITGRRNTIIGFNNGKIDALVLNQAGSTGLSLHASSKFKDQRRRRMIIIQAEGNIDTHMQMLGRVHRTGQVIAPAFDQLVPNIPAIKRPAAVLAKKMASLNANTTGARNSKFSATETLDFMNVYGDEVVAALMEDMPEIHEMLGEPLQRAEEGFEKEDAAKKITGRLPLLPIQTQEDVYDLIAQGYQEALARADALGENALEAKTLPLDARPLTRTVIKEAGNSPSPFADGAYADVVDVKRLGKPFTSAQVKQHIDEALGITDEAKWAHLGRTPEQRRAAAGAAKKQTLIVDNRHAFDAYYKRLMDLMVKAESSEKEIKAEQLRVDTMKDRWFDKMNQLQIGKTYKLYSPDTGTFYGALTGIRHKSKIVNPVAAGAWMFTFDVADGMKTVTLPMSKLTFQQPGALKYFSGLYLTPATEHELFRTPIMKMFDDGQTESREKRIMVTGNLLAGFAQTAKGRIVNYTTADGRTEQGIFLPRSFDIEEFKDNAPVEMTASQARELLRKVDKAIVFSSDRAVSVRSAPQGLLISVSRSKAEGGRYFLDADLRKITGDFVSTGNTMRVVLSPMTAQDAMDLISRKFEQKWVVESYKDEAKAVGGTQMASKTVPIEQKAVDPGHLDIAQTALPGPGEKTLGSDEMQQHLSELFKDSPTQAVAIDPSNPPLKWVRHMKYLQEQGVADRWRGFATTDPTNGRPTVLMRVGGYRSRAELERKAVHEAVHHGLASLFGQTFDLFARRLYNSQGRDTFANEIRDYFPGGNFDDKKPSHVSRVVNEYLARLGERVATDTLSARARRVWDDFMAWLQKALKAIGVTFQLQDEEQRKLRNIVRQSAARGMTGRTGPLPSRSKVSDLGLALKEHRADTAASQNWFKEQLRRGQPIDRLFRAITTPFGAASIDKNGIYHVNPAFKEATRRAAEKLAATATKRFTWLRPMAQKAQFALEDTWGFRLKDRVLHGLVDRYGTPADFIARENQWKQETRSGLLEGRALGERLMESVQSKEEAVLLGAAIRGEEVTDEQVRAVAGPIVDAIEDMGEMLVEAGVLSREAFERNRRKYHHRSYLRYEKEYGSPLVKWAEQFAERRRTKLQGDIFKGRGIKFSVNTQDLRKALPDGWWGARFEENKPDVRLGGTKWRILDRVREPDDASQLKTVEGDSGKKARVLSRVYWPAEEAVPQKFVGYKDRGVYEVRDVKAGNVLLWRDYNAEERMRMGEILDGRYNAVKTYGMMVKDLATAKFFGDIAKNPEWAQSEAPRNPDGTAAWTEAKEITWRRHESYANVEWVRVPTTKIPSSQTYRYGQLAGMYVKAPIWRDIAELEYMQLPGTWKALLGQWKLNKTARSPVVHFNNVMSNFILMDLIDMRFSEWMKGVRSYLRQDEHYQNALRHGVFGTSGNEIDREIKTKILEPILKELDGAASGPAGSLHWISRLTTLLKQGDEWLRERYQMEDELFRMGAYMKFLGQGQSSEEAAARALRQFIDYDIRAPWINMLRTTVLPFISYTYRAVPLLAEAVYNRPWKIAKYMTLAYLANAIGYALSHDDDEDKERRLMDEQYQGYTWMGTPRMVRLPFNDEYQNPAFMDVRRWMPAGDVFDMQGTTVDWMPAWLQIGGPLVMGFELGANVNTYKDEPIYDKDIDTAGEAAGKLAKHAWQGFMPNAPWLPGSYSYENLSNAVTGAKNGAYQDIPTLETLIGAFGPKIRYQNTEFNAQVATFKAEAAEKKIDNRERAAKRAFARSQISEEDLRDTITDLEERKARVQRGLAEKLNGPQEQP